VLAAGFAVAGCANTLPDQDRRIVPAVPVAKLSTDDLWKDYQQSQKEADAKYWGKAVEVAGIVSGVDRGTPPQITFGPAPDVRVRARLLDDQAQALLTAAADGQRLRLKCFCEGFKDAVVQLKSCVKP
jgi:tRNA_anti-like